MREDDISRVDKAQVESARNPIWLDMAPPSAEVGLVWGVRGGDLTMRWGRGNAGLGGGCDPGKEDVRGVIPVARLDGVDILSGRPLLCAAQWGRGRLNEGE